MIAVDWGTSSLRAFRVDAGGRISEQRRSTQGVLVSAGRFKEVLEDFIDGWDDTLLVMSGMIGSQQGWQEMPYVACPAGLEEIAAGMQQLKSTGLHERQSWLVPGLSIRGVDGRHDVMRGEEAQICGLLATQESAEHWVCLAGTHSKLAWVKDGKVVEFHTAMTGEMFAVLTQHSILGKIMQGRELQPEAFLRGVDEAAQGHGLLRDLFSVRTHGLFKEVARSDLYAYLSGVLIGHELNDFPDNARHISLVAAPALAEAYRSALERRGFTVDQVADDVSAHGLYALARQRGLIDA